MELIDLIRGAKERASRTETVTHSCQVSRNDSKE